MTLHLLPGMNFSQWAVTPFCLAGGGDDRYSAGGFGRALGDAASRNSAWCGATAGA